MARDSLLRAISLRVLIAVTAIGFSVSSASGQTGDDAYRFSQRFPGPGASSIGLAGAGIAGFGEAAALSINPAGLGLARRSSVTGSFISFKNTDESLLVEPSRDYPGQSDITNTGLGSISSLYKVPTSRGSLVLGISFNQVSTYERNLFFQGDNGSNSITDFFMPLPGEFEIIDDGTDIYPDFSRTTSFIAFETYGIDFDQALYDAGDPVPFLPAVSAGTVEQIGSVIEEGKLKEVSFGASFEAAKDILVGVSLNLPFSRYTFSREFEEDDVFNDNDGNNGTTDFSYLRYNEWFQSDLYGVNLRVGISALVSPQLRIGAVIETPTAFSVEEEYETTLFTEFDNGDAYSYGNAFGQDDGSGIFKYDILTPWKAGAGLSYSSSGLSVFLDAEWTDWSQLDLSSDDYSFAEENRAIMEGFESVVNTRVGASYDVGDLILRGGFALYPDPHVANALDDPDGANINRDRKFFSLGAGYRFSNELRLDLGWMQERFEDLYVPYTEVAGAPWVEETVTRNRFQVGLTMSI